MADPKQTKYNENIRRRAYELYNMKIDGKRIYVSKVIPKILVQEFGLSEEPTKQTMFGWFRKIKRRASEKMENNLELE